MEYLVLGLTISLAIGFEFVNGFHDTANAVATVIYTNSLKPTYAVIWSGICNFIGVLTSSGTVAFGIIALLPIDLVLMADIQKSLLMILSLLISAISWNLGTWYFGLPISSTHALIGSIAGIGIAHSLLTASYWWNGINWSKMQEVLISLLVSPVLGFGGAALLFLLVKLWIKNEELYNPPEEKVPSIWVRAVLILTCTGVSFAHGSNDGQKGMGLMMLILIVTLPSIFALNLDTSPQEIAQLVSSSNSVIPILERVDLTNSLPNSQTNLQSQSQISSHRTPQIISTPNSPQFNVHNQQIELTNFLQTQQDLNTNIWRSLISGIQTIEAKLSINSSFSDIPQSDRYQIRRDIYLVASTITKLEKQQTLENIADTNLLLSYRDQLNKTTNFIPIWVKFTIAVSLGLGTMIGWKRIVVTVGEKIGKEHLNYAQGATSELVTMTAIGAADYFGVPVSTTHILSSGIAGSMVANKSGVQLTTLKNLLLAWLLTLPSCLLLSFTIYNIGYFSFRVFPL